MLYEKTDIRDHKTVFDTNLWVSYFITGKLTELVDMVLNKGVVLYRSDELTQELTEVMLRPKIKKYFPLNIDEHLAFYERITIYCKTEEKFKDCADAKDNFLFDLAYKSHSNFLVSGDKKELQTPVKKSLKVLNLFDYKSMIGVK
ncbi:putative toxin-antitoxin system toxin component, PIN family [Proteiniphilum sp.]|uniref:putative toxin-antitoxin system toxin component, PIN family n=1 Tax=Proteiniphilum sp. TaxID=1926877 RepID=UPI00332A2ECE